MNTTNLLGYSVFSGELNDIKEKEKYIINTINPHSYCVAKQDLKFKNALINSDILLPDGVGIVIAIKLLYKKTIKKIAGDDLHSFMLEKARKENLDIFYLGSSQNTLSHIQSRLKKEFPTISVGFFSPPFKQIFSDEDNQIMCEAVNSFSPDILFVGMTAPKQEKWVYENEENLNTNIICSIGAVFDFYAGTMSRPPKWLIKIGFEWLGRLLKEPKRMWDRNFHSTPKFMYDILMEFVKGKNCLSK